MPDGMWLEVREMLSMQGYRFDERRRTVMGNSQIKPMFIRHSYQSELVNTVVHGLG